jgi:LysM repeat protein
LRPARRNLKPGFSDGHQPNASLQPLRSWFNFRPMSFRDRLLFSACAMGLGLALSGCTPPDQTREDERKEPHFVLGQNRVNAMDYQGAIEAFEKSLEANPHSATAHYELGWLYDEKEPDPVSAIYHYRQYLKLCPKADNAEIITQRIYTCKQQLAAESMPLSGVPAVQKQLDQLADQNRQLQDEVNKWHAYYSSQLAAVKTNSPSPLTNAVVRPISAQPVITNTNRSGNATTAIRPRTHTVASGETAAGIARKYGVKLSALQAANPGMNPTRIRVGQVLNIPPK